MVSARSQLRSRSYLYHQKEVMHCPNCGRLRSNDLSQPCKVCEKEKSKRRLPCPRCGSLHTGTRGIYNGTNVWRCRDCKRVWIEVKGRKAVGHFTGGPKPIIIETYGNCVRCNKPNQDLANGLCLECYDLCCTAQEQYYWRKKLQHKSPSIKRERS